MGYPRRYVGHYPNLVRWLKDNGHAVYPMEMICKPQSVISSGHSHLLYGFVDVVSYFDGKLWAWEYKSKGDNVLRAVKQVENYARSFDLISVVVEDLRDLDRVVRIKKLRIVTLLKGLGAGVYWVNGEKFELIEDAKQQAPIAVLHEELLARFRRYVFPNEYAKIQRKLRNVEEREIFQKQHKLLTEFL